MKRWLTQPVPVPMWWLLMVIAVGLSDLLSDPDWLALACGLALYLAVAYWRGRRKAPTPAREIVITVTADTSQIDAAIKAHARSVARTTTRSLPGRGGLR